MDGSVISEHEGCTERIAALEQHVSELERSLEQARKERDAEVVRRVEAEEHANRVADVRDAALADNAALVEAMRAGDHDPDCRFRAMFRERAVDPCLGAPRPEVDCDCWKATSYVPHPGAGLLEEVAALRERVTISERAFKQELDASQEETRKAWEAHNALLEEHREELASAARRHETTRATMQVREEQHRKALTARDEARVALAVAKEAVNAGLRIVRETASALGLPDVRHSLPEEARRALVRARNEGLEKAAAVAAKAAEHGCDPYMPCNCPWADKIDSIAGDIRALKEPEGGQS